MRSLYLSLVLAQTVHSLSHVASYSNLWVDPEYILARNFPPETGAAQNTILEWATILASDGPWSASFLSLCRTHPNPAQPSATRQCSPRVATPTTT
jgi:hypothetical protein